MADLGTSLWSREKERCIRRENIVWGLDGCWQAINHSMFMLYQSVI